MTVEAAETAAAPAVGRAEGGWLTPAVLGPVALAAVVVAAVAAAVVLATPSAWRLLGAGRGLVPEPYYPYWALVLLLGTTYGQAVGWAAGSALAAYAWGRVTGRPGGPRAIRGAMILAYLGLAVVPVTLYHAVFGRPLAGLPREGLPERLAASYPDAHALLFTAHPVVDAAPLALAVAVVWMLWRLDDARLGRAAVQTLLALLILGTSFAVALSLGIHAVLVHLRL